MAPTQTRHRHNHPARGTWIRTVQNVDVRMSWGANPSNLQAASRRLVVMILKGVQQHKQTDTYCWPRKRS